MHEDDHRAGARLPAASTMLANTVLTDDSNASSHGVEELSILPEHGDQETGEAKPPRRRRRQWGAEKPRPPLPAIERPASTISTWLGGFAIAATVVMFALYLGITIISQVIDEGLIGSTFVWQAIGYVIVMGFLIASTVAYLLARQGALYRSRDHVRTPRAEIDAFFAQSRPSLTTLVPSYAEDPSVVRATLLSAALQEYPDLRVVLLLDDPPQPSDAAARASLNACRAVPGEIESLLAGPRARFEAALETHESVELVDGRSTADQVRSLGRDYRWAAAWLREQQEAYVRTNNADDFVADEVLGALAADLDTTANAMFAALDQGAAIPAARLSQLCRRLVWTFTAQVSSFERKAYANLPHDANKAMNLNAYIGLMGSRVKRVDTRMGTMLRPTDGDDGVLVPDSDYILTLDADSVILREYCLRLVHHLEMPGNERIAVIQTPYSAFRGAPTRMERIAAATTDIQHILHQGLTYFEATFWVGANAVIRKSALDDIVEVSHVRGQEVRRYVQDRTVIEDTESSIDLVAHGWSLYNYPERLSYSATPPDFGSLAVQRARWANGGLLIAPKFRRLAKARRKEGNRLRRTSIALRVNYMASIAWASLGLVILLTYPFDDRLLSPIIVAAVLPYFLAMAHDFHRMGYKRTDVFRVYAFNLILLSVNLAGTFKSLQQAAAKSKISFARTPKVANRTAAPALHVLAAYAIALFSFFTVINDIRAEHWYHAAFAAFNGLLTTYAIGAFIGFRNSIVDIVLGAVHWIQVPRKPQATDEQTPPEEAWEAVLYFGPDHDPTSGDQLPVAASSTTLPRYGDTRARVRD